MEQQVTDEQVRQIKAILKAGELMGDVPVNPELDRHSKRLQKALRLVAPEEADRIIGESTPVLKALHRGAESLAMMNWWMLKGSGEVEESGLLEMQAQSQAVLLQLVHNAFALGVKAGRGES